MKSTDPQAHRANYGDSAGEQKSGATRERARVVAVELQAQADESRLWVEVFAKNTCGQCSAANTCGQGVLQRWFQRKSRCYPIRCSREQIELLSVGQWVEVEIPEGVLSRAALLVFVLPLCAMILGGALGDSLTGHELGVAAAGLSAFVASLWAIRQLQSNRYFSQQQPRLCLPQG